MNATHRRDRLLAGLLVLGAVGTVSAQVTTNNAYVFCKARITEPGEWGNPVLSVTLPPTPGYTYSGPWGDTPITVWNVGDVAAGGVADTWHDGGPAFFTVRNSGNVNAYVYVTGMSRSEVDSDSNDYKYVLQSLGVDWSYGSIQLLHPRPTPFPAPVEFVGNTPAEDFHQSYHLALTTDATAIAPTWRPLDYCSYNGAAPTLIRRQCSAFLTRMPPGEYQPFDIKFWAPPMPSIDDTHGFVFRVEAASFPLWEHGL